MRRSFIAAIATLAASLAFAQAPAPAPAMAEPAARPVRILFVGNSLTSTGDIPARLQKLATAMGRKATVESEASPDYSLEDHWRDGRALAAIRKGWDFVVLQQGPSGQADSRAQLLEYAKKFAQPIKAAGAKPALYMPWPPQNRAAEFGGVISSYRLAAAAVDGTVLPVGEAWLRALGADKRIRLYSDTVHASSLGQDLAVLTIYLTIFPAGQYEFDEAFVAKAAAALELPADRRDLLFDAATRAIDEPMVIK